MPSTVLKRISPTRTSMRSMSSAMFSATHDAAAWLGWLRMIAVVGGLGAACAWATATMCAARATRLIGAPSVLAWVMLTGLAVTLPWAAIQGRPDIDSSAARWLAVSGVGN